MQRKDMTEKILYGSLWKSILFVALPLMLNNLIQTLYNLADALWVGRLGPEDFAATSFVWPVLFLFISVGIGVSMAGTSILSQLIGASKYKDASEFASLIYRLALGFALLIAALGYFVTPSLIHWMGARGHFARLSADYLQILFLGMPFQFLAFATNAVFQAQGITMLTTTLSAVSAGLNMVLNPFFIFSRIPGTQIAGLGWGVAGAAWATVLAQGVLVVIGFLFVRYKSVHITVQWRRVPWNKERIFLIGRIGIPSAIGQSGAAFGFIILNGIIAAFGTDTLAAFGLVNRVSGIGMLPAMGIGAALTTVVGQNIGRGQIPRAKDSLRWGFLMTLAVTVTLTIPLYLFDYPILNFFMPAERTSPVMVLALHFLLYAVFLNPLMGFFSVLQGFFQGTGHTRYSMMMEVIRLWGIRLPMIWILQALHAWTRDGIWYAMIVSNLLVVVLGLWFYRNGKWKTRVMKEELSDNPVLLEIGKEVE